MDHHVDHCGTKRTHLGPCSRGRSMATELPLLLLAGTCLECRAAPFLWPGALNQFCARHTSEQLCTHSHSASVSLTFFLLANRDDLFACRDPRERLKRTILTLNWTSSQAERGPPKKKERFKYVMNSMKNSWQTDGDR